MTWPFDRKPKVEIPPEMVLHEHPALGPADVAVSDLPKHTPDVKTISADIVDGNLAIFPSNMQKLLENAFLLVLPNEVGPSGGKGIAIRLPRDEMGSLVYEEQLVLGISGDGFPLMQIGKMVIDIVSANIRMRSAPSGAITMVVESKPTLEPGDASLRIVRENSYKPELSRELFAVRENSTTAPGRLTVGSEGEGTGASTFFANQEGKRIVIDPDQGSITIRSEAGGSLRLTRPSGKESLVAGASPSGAGFIKVLGAEGEVGAALSAEDCMLTLGRPSMPGKIELLGTSGQECVTIDGAKGDVILHGGDCAEYFLTLDENLVPGMAVEATGGEYVCATRSAFSSRIVGVVAGAGGIEPGILLHGGANRLNRVPVSLVGQAYCLADASEVPITLGALLVSSPTPGHVMAANRVGGIEGCVVGKALQTLSSGRGLVRALVCLE